MFPPRNLCLNLRSNQASLILKIVQGKVKRLDEKYGSRRLVNLVAKYVYH